MRRARSTPKGAATSGSRGVAAIALGRSGRSAYPRGTPRRGRGPPPDVRFPTQADTAELDRFCSAHGFYAWFDVSAKTGFNIDAAIRCLVEKILDDPTNIQTKVGANAEFRPAVAFAEEDAGSYCSVA